MTNFTNQTRVKLFGAKDEYEINEWLEKHGNQVIQISAVGLALVVVYNKSGDQADDQ